MKKRGRINLILIAAVVAAFVVIFVTQYSQPEKQTRQDFSSGPPGEMGTPPPTLGDIPDPGFCGFESACGTHNECATLVDTDMDGIPDMGWDFNDDGLTDTWFDINGNGLGAPMAVFVGGVFSHIESSEENEMFSDFCAPTNLEGVGGDCQCQFFCANPPDSPSCPFIPHPQYCGEDKACGTYDPDPKTQGDEQCRCFELPDPSENKCEDPDAPCPAMIGVYDGMEVEVSFDTSFYFDVQNLQAYNPNDDSLNKVTEVAIKLIYFDEAEMQDVEVNVEPRYNPGSLTAFNDVLLPYLPIDIELNDIVTAQNLFGKEVTLKMILRSHPCCLGDDQDDCSDLECDPHTGHEERIIIPVPPSPSPITFGYPDTKDDTRIATLSNSEKSLSSNEIVEIQLDPPHGIEFERGSEQFGSSIHFPDITCGCEKVTIRSFNTASGAPPTVFDNVPRSHRDLAMPPISFQNGWTDSNNRRKLGLRAGTLPYFQGIGHPQTLVNDELYTFNYLLAHPFEVHVEFTEETDSLLACAHGQVKKDIRLYRFDLNEDGLEDTGEGHSRLFLSRNKAFRSPGNPPPPENAQLGLSDKYLGLSTAAGSSTYAFSFAGVTSEAQYINDGYNQLNGFSEKKAHGSLYRINSLAPEPTEDYPLFLHWIEPAGVFFDKDRIYVYNQITEYQIRVLPHDQDSWFVRNVYDSYRANSLNLFKTPFPVDGDVFPFVGGPPTPQEPNSCDCKFKIIKSYNNGFTHPSNSRIEFDQAENDAGNCEIILDGGFWG
jgi:hypothetical protein